MAAHGFPRYTKDLDVWVECSRDNATRIAAALDDFGFGSLGITVDDLATPDLVIQLGYEPTTIDGLALPVIDRLSLAANKRAFGRPLDLADAAELEK